MCTAIAAVVKSVCPSTPPPSCAVTADKSLLISSAVRSSDVTRVLQQRRQEWKENVYSQVSLRQTSYKDKKKVASGGWLLVFV